MKEFKKTSPPKWAERFLSWYCKPSLLEDLQGDLNEYFERNVKTKGSLRAKLIYVADVFKFLRLYTIRKPELINLLINWIMLRSYIKTSGRSIVRHKLFSTINIAGLAISMSVGLMMISVLNDVFSYDKFHKNHNRIYRLISQYEYLGRKDNDYMATTSLKAAKAIQETFSVPEDVAILKREFDGDVKVDEKIIPLNGFLANPSVLKTFSFELLEGNAITALKEPFSVVLTEKSAKKLFGNDEALGKVVTLKDKQYTITGILKDIPMFSHIKFDMLGSLSTLEIIAKDDKGEMAWDNIWNTWVYLLLPANADLKDLKVSLDQLSKKEDLTIKNTHIELALQPMDDIMTGESLGNQIGPVMGRSMLWIFIGLAFVVILSACFNYTNLSIARSLRRTREVGIRKVIGALKSHVLGQFVVEAVLISLCSLVLAFFLFVFLKPFFLTIEPEIQKIFVLNLSPVVMLYFVLFAIFIGIAAGIFPALFFSRVNPLQVMRDFAARSGFKKMTVRKMLIVFQYSISIIFITSTVIIYKQYKHFVSYDLGFQTENILNISLQGNKAAALKNELNQLSEVKEISQSMIVTSVGNYWGTQMKFHTNPHDSTGVYYNIVDENYLPLHKHKLLAGRNFIAKADSSKETEVIVNEQVLKRFNIAEQNPAKALNEFVTVDGKDMQIIGVMKNFHYGKVNDNVSQKEIILRYSNTEARLLNVKIQSTDLLSTYAKIEAIWKKYDPVHPFEAKFYDQQIDEAFAGMRASVKMAGFLAFLAICIASLGLLGMVVFTTETRLKEISIRKVLGASEAGLMYLLGRGFFVLLGIATAIAIPVTYLFFDRILFQEMANHAPISVGDLSLGVLSIMTIAFLMIGSQTLKVARTNPSEVLKSE
ncbi:MAG TPA: ABC transporter permease [Cyclobacteriaceae bacterium]|nr:ABC transporter permease [Cyclobacteriaceae bacterium]